jgi:hypothetical protein
MCCPNGPHGKNGAENLSNNAGAVREPPLQKPKANAGFSEKAQPD